MFPFFGRPDCVERNMAFFTYLILYTSIEKYMQESTDKIFLILEHFIIACLVYQMEPCGGLSSIDPSVLKTLYKSCNFTSSNTNVFFLVLSLII